MKKRTLKNGIIVHDNRELSFGFRFENNDGKYMSLSYSPWSGFYINISSGHFDLDDLAEFQKELETMRLALIEINEITK